jgi:hypothetical protein
MIAINKQLIEMCKYWGKRCKDSSAQDSESSKLLLFVVAVEMLANHVRTMGSKTMPHCHANQGINGPLQEKQTDQQ